MTPRHRHGYGRGKRDCVCCCVAQCLWFVSCPSLRPSTYVEMSCAYLLRLRTAATRRHCPHSEGRATVHPNSPSSDLTTRGSRATPSLLGSLPKQANWPTFRKPRSPEDWRTAQAQHSCWVYSRLTQTAQQAPQHSQGRKLRSRKKHTPTWS